MKVKLSNVDDKGFDDLRSVYPDDELARIDGLTPIMDSLSPIKRSILTALVRHGRPVRICELTDIARLGQQNKASSYVSRLLKEGFLEKRNDCRYYFNSRYPDLEKYLILRTKSFSCDV